MRNNKQGVSLIVLVITIIVMIILAAAVMISLSNTGILDKANEAVDATNLKTAQQIASIAWSEAYIDNMDVTDEEAKLENITKAVEKALTDNGVDITKYAPTVTINGVTVVLKGAIPADWKASVREVTDDGVPIPIGFVKSPYDNEGTKDGGLVIYALTETEITNGVTDITAIDDDHQDSLETRNQFVWVPVDSDNFETLFVRSNNGMKASDGNDKYALSSTLGTNYWELVLTANNMVSQDTESDNVVSYVSAYTLTEATAMYESVKKYGGFYIARYEVGTTSTYEDSSKGHIATRVSIDAGTNTNLSVTMAKYPYAAVAWGTSMSDETSDNRAVSLSRSFYPSDETTYGVVSTLTYGVQWDRTLAWWEELDALDGTDDRSLTSSTGYGVYYDTTIASTELNANAKYSVYASSKYGTWGTITEKTASGSWLLTTGAYTKANVYNIYDMAGNLYEWTMEGYSTFSRVLRGGNFSDFGVSTPVAYRNDLNPTNALYYYGFRPSLYIK